MERMFVPIEKSLAEESHERNENRTLLYKQRTFAPTPGTPHSISKTVTELLSPTNSITESRGWGELESRRKPGRSGGIVFHGRNRSPRRRVIDLSSPERGLKKKCWRT